LWRIEAVSGLGRIDPSTAVNLFAVINRETWA